MNKVMIAVGILGVVMIAVSLYLAVNKVHKSYDERVNKRIDSLVSASTYKDTLIADLRKSFSQDSLDKAVRINYLDSLCKYQQLWWDAFADDYPWIVKRIKEHIEENNKVVE
jgi:hypothetical protein